MFRLFNREDAENILRIPISLADKEDQYFWLHSRRGQYTVKSGYKWLRQMEERNMGTGNVSEGPSYDDQHA